VNRGPIGTLLLQALIQGGFHMSNSELAILFHLTEGKTSKEIARDVCLSKATVDLRIRMLCQKLQARSRAQLVAIAIQDGLINR